MTSQDRVVAPLRSCDGEISGFALAWATPADQTPAQLGHQQGVLGEVTCLAPYF
jgi:hypothetical protein